MAPKRLLLFIALQIVLVSQQIEAVSSASSTQAASAQAAKPTDKTVNVLVLQLLPHDVQALDTVDTKFSTHLAQALANSSSTEPEAIKASSLATVYKSREGQQQHIQQQKTQPLKASPVRASTAGLASVSATTSMQQPQQEWKSLVAAPEATHSGASRSSDSSGSQRKKSSEWFKSFKESLDEEQAAADYNFVRAKHNSPENAVRQQRSADAEQTDGSYEWRSEMTQRHKKPVEDTGIRYQRWHSDTVDAESERSNDRKTAAGRTRQQQQEDEEEEDQQLRRQQPADTQEQDQGQRKPAKRSNNKMKRKPTALTKKKVAAPQQPAASTTPGAPQPQPRTVVAQPQAPSSPTAPETAPQQPASAQDSLAAETSYSSQMETTEIRTERKVTYLPTGDKKEVFSESKKVEVVTPNTKPGSEHQSTPAATTPGEYQHGDSDDPEVNEEAAEQGSEVSEDMEEEHEEGDRAREDSDTEEGHMEEHEEGDRAREDSDTEIHYYTHPGRHADGDESNEEADDHWPDRGDASDSDEEYRRDSYEPYHERSEDDERERFRCVAATQQKRFLQGRCNPPCPLMHTFQPPPKKTHTDLHSVPNTCLCALSHNPHTHAPTQRYTDDHDDDGDDHEERDYSRSHYEESFEAACLRETARRTCQELTPPDATITRLVSFT